MGTIDVPEKKGRLIVLVPECLVNDMDMINKIYQMATREQREVFYLALADDDARILTATRSIATLKALVSGGRISSASRVVETSHWVSALREVYRPGDVIVCHEEQQVRSGFLHTVPASEFLQTRYQVPVRIISGYYHPDRLQIGRWLSRIIFWAGLLAILAAFFFLEIQMDHAVHGITRTVLLIILLGVELVAGIAWNQMSSR